MNSKLIICIAMGLLLQGAVVSAWTAPTAVPPAGNVPAPINTGSGSAVQNIDGTLGVDKLMGFSSIGLTFTNTAAGTSSRWMMRANDGSANFAQYINSNGTAAPVRLSAGYAWREAYDLSTGNYTFFTSSSTAAANTAITWKPSLRILGNGRVGADSYCDINGGNCVSMKELVTVAEGGGNEVVYFDSPKEIYGPAEFRSTSDVRRSYNFLSGDYPSNIIRAYILVQGSGYPDTVRSTRDDGNQTYPGFAPWVSYYPVFATAPTAIATLSKTTNERKGDWVAVKDDVVDLIANCGSTGCGQAGTFYVGGLMGVNYPTLTVQLGGYECSGPCDDGGIAAACDVNFSWNINGKTGSSRERLYGTEQMAIGMNYDKDDWEWSPHLWDFYTENLDQHGWGGSTWDSSERAMVGYFDPRNYQRNKSTLNSYNSNYGHIVVRPLDMVNGETLTISNKAVSEIPAGTVTLTARVSNCVQ